MAGTDECPVCYVSVTKPVASPTFAPSGSACAQYSGGACCTADVVYNITTGHYFDEFPGYGWDRCGPLSRSCQQFFQDEACFYECDSNIGRFRKYPSCYDGTGTPNSYEVAGMPIKASYWDAWFEACKDDKFCTDGTTNGQFNSSATNSFYALPTNGTCDAVSCMAFSQIYADGQALAETMFAGAYTYEADEDTAFTMRFPENATDNPNDGVSDAREEVDPQHCPYTATFDDETECADGETTAAADAVRLGDAWEAWFAIAVPPPPPAPSNPPPFPRPPSPPRRSPPPVVKKRPPPPPGRKRQPPGGKKNTKKPPPPRKSGG